MKISEYALMEEAFNRSFAFMLNRIEEFIGPIKGRKYDDRDRNPAEERCFDEFINALAEMGVELGETGRDLTELVVLPPLPPPGKP